MEKEWRSRELRGLRHKRSRLWMSLELATVKYNIIQMDSTPGVSSERTWNEVKEGESSLGGEPSLGLCILSITICKQC